MTAPDVLVVGAGITGAAASLALAEAGAKVLLMDAHGPASMASGWTLAGVRQSGRHPAELPLARDAVSLWPSLADRLGAPTHYRQGGNLRLARTDDEVPVIRDLVETQRAAGLDLTFLPSAHNVRAVAPNISPTIEAASFCPTDGHADPIATVAAYVAAAERAGVTASFGERVHELATDASQITTVVTSKRRLSVDAVLLACGVETNTLLAQLDREIPMRIPIVTVVQTAPLPALLEPVLGVANADLAVRQEVTGRLRLTSGAEPFEGTIVHPGGRPKVRPKAAQIAGTLKKVTAVLPALSNAEVETIWGGLLDLTPDALPVIDRLPGFSNVVVAAGFSGHGFGIGPVTGPLAADLILAREPRHDLRPFSYARFDEIQTRAPAAELTLHG